MRRISAAAQLTRRFLYTWLYQILLSCAIGGVIGFLARRSLKYAEAQDWIEDESFLAYGLGLTFLVLGIVGSASSNLVPR